MVRGRIRLWILAIPFLSTAPASAQETPLRSFEPLIDGVWVAEGEQNGLGRYQVERTYAWALGGRYVRVLQTLTLAGDQVVEEETLIGWDAEAGRYTLWGFASDGSRTDALGDATAPNRFVFTGRTYGARTGDWRMTTFIIDEASMSVLLELRARGTFEPVMTFAFRRTGSGTD